MIVSNKINVERIYRTSSGLSTHPETNMSSLHRSIMDRASKGKDIIVKTGEIDNDSERRALLFLPPLATIRRSHRSIQALIIAADEKELQRTVQLFNREHAGRARFTSVALDGDRSHLYESRLFKDAPRLIFTTSSRIIDHIRRNSIDLSNIRTCVIDEPPSGEESEFHADLRFVYSKLSRSLQTSAFTTEWHTGIDDLKLLLRRPVYIDGNLHFQGESTMKNDKFQMLMSNALVRQKIKSVVRSIQEDEDPAELNAYRRLFRKQVNVFRRAYFSAYLLKQLAEQQRESGTRRSSSTARRTTSGSRSSATRVTRRGGGTGRRTSSSSATASAPILVENGKYASVYVGVGRNRHASREELSELFTDIIGINEDSLGNIQILDNFSFVEVATDVATKAIETLDGSRLRGRRLTVAYARSKPRSNEFDSSDSADE